MLDDLRFPSGVTFAQAKKDAKRLAKSQSIPHTEALDRIAAQHGLAMPWAKVPAALHELNADIASLPLPVTGQPEFHVSLTGLRNEAVVIGRMGSGKSVGLIQATNLALPEQATAAVLCTVYDPIKSTLPDTSTSTWQLGTAAFPDITTSFHSGVPGYPDIRSLDLPAGSVILLDEGIPTAARPYWPECQAWARDRRIALVYLLQDAEPLTGVLNPVNIAFVLSHQPSEGSGHQFSLRLADGRESIVDFYLWSAAKRFKDAVKLVMTTDPEISTFYLQKNSTAEAQATTLEAAQKLWSEGKNATIVGRFKGM
ncbi:hypothetical protein [Ectopseudomonas mendocina]|uniref:Uncharacterized protein n=1 Tax=Ectopseudomonas mendocina S5.2 TaxID=1225174 RepID=A0ABM5W3K5_ECTME|nr:hypothetical protein [Pseudomonas mendocina]ALN21834.1 hypothetical protein DW68_024455 [Pseudomonas mendocina S5.2]KER98112.1 hypothetical protein HN51_25265 [Pseudomonas mendocina]